MKTPAWWRLFWMALIWAGLAACAPQPQITLPAEGAGNVSRPYAIHVVSHGWHTGMVLPAGELQQRLPLLLARFADAPYLEVGWGDAAYYQADRGTAGLALRALLWPTDSVMHVVAVPDKAERHFSSSPKEKLCLTQKQYAALVEFVVASFAVAQGSDIMSLGTGLYGDSEFYRARGRYHLFNTCNTWIARGLREAGLPVTPTLMVTAKNLMDFLRLQQTEHETGDAYSRIACD